MNIFKYWAKYQEIIPVKNWVNPLSGKQKDIAPTYNFIGGSNISEREALVAAKEKRNRIKAIISGNPLDDTDYEVDIVEEIITTIDEDNIVTRNRYGALVLNSAHLMFVDIDNSQFRHSYFFKTGILTLLKNSFIKISLDEKIENHIAKIASKTKHQNHSFRIYKTPAGYRVIVIGEKFVAKSKEAQKILSSFGSDWLYKLLCKKQNCFRARLTPKPHRIKIKRHRVIFPFRTVDEEKIHQNWVSNYENKSGMYAACKFIREIGKKNYSELEIVKYHDRKCNALSSKTIA